ncbi:MAG: hypothetical protein HYS12_00075 [Planctomycetes bacterium]|nr:hypothetical protein [Planctomycetota bacterium]
MQSLPTCFSWLRGRLPVLALLTCLLVVPVAQAQTSRHGGIEIGAKGVKATVLEVTPGKEGLNSKQLFSKTANTTLSALKDGKFREDAIDETGEEVEKFFKLMQADFKVPAKNIYVVASSGLPKPPNREAFVKVIKEKTGKDLRTIDADTEVMLTIMGVVRPELRATSLLADIGSGNTKGGYLEQGTPGAEPRLVAFSVPLGTVTFTAQVKKAGGDKFVETAVRLRGTALEKPIADAVAKNPGLAKRDRVYLSGGMVWAMVTLLKPETVEESFVSLTTDDIENFHKLVTKDPAAFPKVALDKVKDEKVRSQAGKDVARVRDTYTPENLVAGSEILRALSSTLQLKGKQVFFPRFGYVAWIQAYVEEQTAPGTGETKKPPPKDPEKVPLPVEKPPVSPGVIVSPPIVYAPSCYGRTIYYYSGPSCTVYPSGSYYVPSCYTPCRRGFRLFRR